MKKRKKNQKEEQKTYRIIVNQKIKRMIIKRPIVKRPIVKRPIVKRIIVKIWLKITQQKKMRY